MKLLKMSLGRGEFYDLQPALDRVAASRSVVEACAADLKAAKNNLMRNKDQKPTDPEKAIEWDMKKQKRLIDVSVHIYAIEDALGDLQDALSSLGRQVELCRAVAESVEEGSTALPTTSFRSLHDEDETYERAALNVLIADRYRSESQAVLVEQRANVYVFDDSFATEGCLSSAFVSMSLAANRRHFTVRFKGGDGRWHYVQKEHEEETDVAVPSLPALTAAEADLVRARMVKHFAHSSPRKTVEVERYDIKRGCAA